MDFSLKIDIQLVEDVWKRDISVLFTDPGAYISAAISKIKVKYTLDQGAMAQKGNTLLFLLTLR